MRIGSLLAILLTLALAPAARGAAPNPPRADFMQLFDEYRTFGFIIGCTHRESDMREALSGIPADIQAYDPGFADALNSGLEQRAAGCRGPLSLPFPQIPVSNSGTVLAADGSPGPGNQRVSPPLPTPQRADTSMPPALIWLVAMVGASLLVAAGFVLARLVGWGRGGPGRPAGHH